MQVRAEGAVYDEQVNGALNLNSYAAMAVAGIVSEAFEHLTQTGQQITGESLARFTDVLAGIVLRAQYATTGQISFQRGAQTRLRGLLRTILPNRPAPFGRPAAEWEAWMSRTERFLIVALTEAMSLYERSPVQNESHLYFAVEAAN
jgi:putative RecB family exonuclease